MSVALAECNRDRYRDAFFQESYIKSSQTNARFVAKLCKLIARTAVICEMGLAIHGVHCPASLRDKQSLLETQLETMKEKVEKDKQMLAKMPPLPAEASEPPAVKQRPSSSTSVAKTGTGAGKGGKRAPKRVPPPPDAPPPSGHGGASASASVSASASASASVSASASAGADGSLWLSSPPPPPRPLAAKPPDAGADDDADAGTNPFELDDDELDAATPPRPAAPKPAVLPPTDTNPFPMLAGDLFRLFLMDLRPNLLLFCECILLGLGCGRRLNAGFLLESVMVLLLDACLEKSKEG
jgi:hypothetical protein